MQRLLALLISGAVGVLAMGLVACGPDEQLVAAAARTEASTHLEQSHADLVQKRLELKTLRAQIAAGAEALVVTEGIDRAAAFAALVAQEAELASATTALADGFMTEVVTFINEDPMVQGEEPKPEQLAAIRMKSGEDLELALEYVEKGGDWKRAEDIIQRALVVDPNNELLKEKLAWALDMRFVTRERFDKLEKGMTQEQIKAVVGPVNLRNIKEFPGDRIGWFYRKNPDTEGGAAGVFFEKKRGVWTAYELDYSAIEGTSEG